MCLRPHKIADVGFVACRECWQCRERKVDDWVGRNIAESQTAAASCVVSLTYGRDKSTGGVDHIRAALLTYSDVQKMLKRLRVEGYPVRYFVCGEYGSTKGRAHWHIILYWQGAVPDYDLRQKFYLWKFWPHGYAYFDEMSASAVRYACKYLLKEASDPTAQAFGPMVSKKPPLGDAYFKGLADRYVEAQLSPQDLFYSFPDVRRVPRGTTGASAKALRDSAQPIDFLMNGKTAENFLGYFVDRYRAVHGDEPPRSEIVWDYLDGRMRDYFESVSVPQFIRRGKVPVPPNTPVGGTKPRFDEGANAFWSYVDGGKLWWSYDTEGELQWHEKIRPDAAKQRWTEVQAAEDALKASYRAQRRGL